MHDRKRVLILIFVMALVVLLAGGSGIFLLYRAAFEEQRARLVETAISQAKLIEAIAQNEMSERNASRGVEASILEQIQSAHTAYEASSPTGEITVGRIEGDQIVFLLSRLKVAPGTSRPSVPMNGKIAEGTRLALAGRSGTLVGIDYRGQMVLAAYEPVKSLGWSVVAKIDIAQIRQPFIEAGITSATLAAIAVLVAAWVFVRVTDPLLLQVHNSELQLYNAIVKSPLPVIIHCEDGRILSTSETLHQRTGFAPEQLRSMSDWVNCAFSSRPDIRALADQPASAAARVAYGEQEITTAKGTRRIWDFSSATLGTGPDGKLLTITIATDITERKRAEEALAGQNEHLDVTLRSIADAVITVDVRGNIVLMNRVAEQLTGYSDLEAFGKPISGVFRTVNQLSQEPTLSPVEQVLRTGAVVSLTQHTALIRRDGSQRIIANSGSPIVNRQGQITGVVLVFRDNTDIEQAHEAVRTAGRLAQSTIDALSSNICVIDENGTVIAVNRAWREFGEMNSGILDRCGEGANYFTICACAMGEESASAKSFAAGIRSVMRGDNPEFSLEYTCHSPAERHWFLGKVTRFEGGGPVRVVVAHEDITERKLAEERLASAKAAAESANRAKDRFIATLSHELRTPLTPVLATLCMLQEDRQLPAMVAADVAMMRQHVELETKLIDDLLDLTRIARGKLRMEVQAVDAIELLERALTIASQSDDVHKLQLHREFAAPVSLVMADAARLQQAFWNVMKNAMQYTPDGGSLTIRTSLPAEGLWQVQFIDSGVGIDPQFLPRMFQTFEQGDTGELRRANGLGLGMAISRAVMEQLGGSVTAFSAGIGKGSTFTLRLPLAVKVAASGSNALPAAASDHDEPLRILLVEDHGTTLQILARYLHKMGHEVNTATNVKEAIALAKSQTFNLLISDIGLPDGSGLDVMRWIRANRKVNGIAISGYGMDTDLQASYDAGFAIHLVKPVDLGALRAAISNTSSLGKLQTIDALPIRV